MKTEYRIKVDFMPDFKILRGILDRDFDRVNHFYIPKWEMITSDTVRCVFEKLYTFVAFVLREFTAGARWLRIERLRILVVYMWMNRNKHINI